MTVNEGRDNGGADNSSIRGAERELTDRYRQASAKVGERPSASVRASILAAAAREVGAKPVDAATLHRGRPRWPLAAAAAVMLSTLAVMLAIRTSEEMPQFSAPPEPARSAADNVATPAATSPAASMAEQSISKSDTQDAQAVERPLARTQERSVPRLKEESDSVADAPREASPPVLTEAPKTAPANEEERARQNVPAATPAPPALPPPEPAARAKLRAEQPAAAGAAAQAPPMDQASSDARRDAAKPAAPAPLAAAQSERKQADESAALWLERIIKLRREGRHDEADAELKRFRERYPQVQPPAEALLPAGTR